MVREVTPGVFLITQKKRTRFAPFSVNVYVIAGENGLVFDAGMGGKKTGDELVRQIRGIEETMRARGQACRIARVLPSHGHWDHFSGVEGLRKRLGLQVLATPRMQAAMGSKAVYRKSYRKESQLIEAPSSFIRRWVRSLGHALTDALFFRIYKIAFVTGPMDTVEDQAVFEINGERWELMEMPGHCDDDVVLFNRTRGILLCGDIVLRALNTWLGPPRSDLKRYLGTLEKLMVLPGLTMILPAHGSPITEPYKRLKAARDHRGKRTLEVFNLIKHEGPGGIDFEKLFKRIYPSLSFKERFIAKGWILLTLQYLIDENRVGMRLVKHTTQFYCHGSVRDS